jgi:Zn-dependent membrane protease YugP
MKVLVLSLLTSVVFLLAGILWWSDGNKIVGVLLFAAALFFGSMGFVQGKKTNKK